MTACTSPCVLCGSTLSPRRYLVSTDAVVCVDGPSCGMRIRANERAIKRNEAIEADDQLALVGALLRGPWRDC